MVASVKPALRLKTAEFDKLTRAFFGPLTLAELADKLGVNYLHLISLRTGKRNAGAGFVATLKTVMPNVPVEQLFEVVDGRPERAA